jgi:hypothetical protein
MFGRWKTKIHDDDDDPDLWHDLIFVSPTETTKPPPPIPKILILQDEDDEDISTICGGTASFHGVPSRQHHQMQQYHRPTTKASSIPEEKKEDEYSEMFGHDLELELEEEDVPLEHGSAKRKVGSNSGSHSHSFLDADDASLESIMGSYISLATGTSSRLRGPSLLRQHQEQYQRFVDSFSYSFTTVEDGKVEENTNEYNDGDGSSYSSYVRRKLTFVVNDKGSHRANPSASSTASGSARHHRASFSLQTNSHSTDTSSTVQAKNIFEQPKRSRSSISDRSKRKDHRGKLISERVRI